ncbi:MAG: hypothetical protein ACYC7L_05210 [Nitrospirota bacterium]
MNASLTNGICRKKASALVCLLAAFCIVSGSAGAETASPPVNAFSVKKLPKNYIGLEKFFQSLRNSGANTLIMELPLTGEGFPDVAAVPNVVFLAHQSGIKLFVVLPTRKLPGPIALHAEWEDRRYDIANDAYQLSGKLDLFNQAAVSYLAVIAKELASFSVDAVILGEDFRYEPVDGMSRTASKFAAMKLDADIDPASMYRKISKGPDGPVVTEYSDLFVKWTRLKRDRLLEVYETIRTAARSANGDARFGLAVPVDYPVLEPADALSAYAFDWESYRRQETDLFLAVIPYREIQEARSMAYRQVIEMVSRIARSVLSASKNGLRVVLVVPMTERLTAKSLRYSEIEEITGLLRAGGETGIGYEIKADTLLNKEFTSKLFKK